MKSTTRHKLLYFIGIILCLNAVQSTEGSKTFRTSARSIAVRAGAAHFKESIEDSDQATRRRRLVDDSDQNDDSDNDYETYQGVVGVPGIDFPVFVGIPRTGFNCRKMGNGYFADLDTDCQVFHICDTGRKISFLCPNGTIFKQDELICDWWFKVDCSKSPDLYVKSAELLAVYRNKKQPPVNLYDKSTPRKNYRTEKDQQLAKSRSRATQTPRSVEYTSRQISRERSEIDEIFTRRPQQVVPEPTRKLPPSIIRTNTEDDIDTLDARIDYSTETQVVAESGSFIQQNGGYSYNKPQDKEEELKNIQKTQKQDSVLLVVDYVEVPIIYEEPKTEPPTTKQPTKSSLSGSRRRGSSKFRQTKQSGLSLTTATPSFANDNSYTTAKRLGTTNNTPFYTPTVPTVNTKTNEISRITTTESTPIEHAIEMLETLKKLDEEILPPVDITKSYETQARVGLVIPPSSGPDTINSLASYFATSVDTLSKQTVTESTPIQTENITLSKIISQKTAEKYDELFKDESSQTTTVSDVNISNEDKTIGENLDFGSGESEINTTDEKSEEIEKSEQESATKTIISKILTEDEATDSSNDLKAEIASTGTPQVRELAQVFTHALSEYFDNPQEFRKTLTDIRPTEPPVLSENEDVVEPRGGETDFYTTPTVSTNGATYLPTASTSAEATMNEKEVESIKTEGTSASFTSAEDLEVLDFSDVTLPATNKRKEPTVSDLANEKIETTTSIVEIVEATTKSDEDEEKSIEEIATQAEISSTSYPISEVQPFNKKAELTPASDLISTTLVEEKEKTVDDAVINTESRVETDTDSDTNTLAIEINKVLQATTQFPFASEEEEETKKTEKPDEKEDSDISNYFPVEEEAENEDQKPTYKPYGEELNIKNTPKGSEDLSSNIETITSKSSDNVNLNQSNEKSAEVNDVSSVETITVVNTNGLDTDLLPPSKTNDNIQNDVITNQNVLISTGAENLENVEESTVADEEQLQQAQSQSIIAGMNELIQSEKSEKLAEEQVEEKTLVPESSEEEEKLNKEEPEVATVAQNSQSETSEEIVVKDIEVTSAASTIDSNESVEVSTGNPILSRKIDIRGHFITHKVPLATEEEPTTATIVIIKKDKTTKNEEEQNVKQRVEQQGGEIFVQVIQEEIAENKVETKGEEQIQKGKEEKEEVKVVENKEAQNLESNIERRGSEEVEEKLEEVTENVQPGSEEKLESEEDKKEDNVSNKEEQSVEVNLLVENEDKLVVTTTVTAEIESLDPLIINDELLDSSKGDTIDLFSSEEILIPTTIPENESVEVVTTEASKPTPIKSNPQQTRRGKTFPTTSFPTRIDPEVDNLQRLDKEEPIETMREKAQEIFGGLNDTEADSLMHVMKTADSDKNVKKLILLLIQTCEDDFNKTIEDSRKELLNALIRIDSQNEPEIHIINTRINKKQNLINVPTTSTSTTTQTPTTTTPIETTVHTEFRIDLSDENDFYSTSTTGTSTSTAPTPTAKSPSKRRKSKSLDRALSNLDSVDDSKHSDERALELLKSLYSLASRWGTR